MQTRFSETHLLSFIAKFLKKHAVLIFTFTADSLSVFARKSILLQDLVALAVFFHLFFAGGTSTNGAQFSYFQIYTFLS